jgi:hypothetical protein
MPSFDAFRREIGRRADDAFADARFAGLVDAHGDAEVHHARHAVGVDQDVGGLEIAVDDAMAVRVLHGVEDLQHHLDGAWCRQAALLAQLLCEGATLDILEHEVGIAVLFAGIEDRHDVRVAQLADCARLVHQCAFACLVPAGEMQRLDGDLALQMGIVGQIDDALCPGAEHAEDVELADFPRLGGGISHFWTTG